MPFVRYAYAGRVPFHPWRIVPLMNDPQNSSLMYTETHVRVERISPSLWELLVFRAVVHSAQRRSFGGREILEQLCSSRLFLRNA